MATVFLPFIALYSAVLLLMTGIGLLGTFLPVQLTVAGASTQTIGMVASSYFVGMLVGTFLCHRLIRSVGHIRSFAALAALVTAVVMLHGLYLDAVFWSVLRFLSGLATIGLYMIIESWLNECTQRHQRGKVLAIYMIMSYLGMTLGQQLLNFGNTFNLPMFYVVGLMLALCLVPVTLTHSIHPQLPDFERINALELFRKAPTGMLGCLSAGLLSSAFYSISPVFCHLIGLSISQLTLVMTVTILGGMLLQWPIGSLSDNFDRTYVLVFLGFMVALLSLAIFYSAGSSYALFLALMTAFGGLAFTLYPVAVARTHDLFEAKDIVPVSSVLMLSYGVGASMGPILASSTMTFVGSPYGLFVYFSAVGAGYAMVTLYLRKQKIVTVVASEDNSDFILMKNTSPITAAIVAPDEFDRAMADDGVDIPDATATPSAENTT